MSTWATFIRLNLKNNFQENRRLKFWFIEGTDHSRKLNDSYDFFKDLVNQESFPKGFWSLQYCLPNLNYKYLTNIVSNTTFF